MTCYPELKDGDFVHDLSQLRRGDLLSWHTVDDGYFDLRIVIGKEGDITKAYGFYGSKCCFSSVKMNLTPEPKTYVLLCRPED